MKKNILYLFTLLSLLVLVSACSKVSDEDLQIAHKAYKNGAIIIDVRTREEYRQKHIDKAVNIPLQLLEKYLEHLPLDKAFITYCRSGSRSKMAAEFLRKNGFTVYDVATQEDWDRELPQK